MEITSVSSPPNGMPALEAAAALGNSDLPELGRAAAEASLPFASSTEDKTLQEQILAVLVLLNQAFSAPVTAMPPPGLALVANNPFARGQIAQTAATTTVSFAAPSASEKAAVYEIHLQITNYAADVLLTFKSGSTTLFTVKLDADTKQGNIDLAFRGFDHFHSLAVDEDLTMTISSTCDVNGWWDYVEGEDI